MEVNASDVLSFANQIMTLSAAMVGFAALVCGGLSIWLSINFNKDKKELIRQASDEFLQRLKDDEQLQAHFMAEILKHPKFINTFERMVDIHTADKVDAWMNEEKSSQIGGLK